MTMMPMPMRSGCGLQVQFEWTGSALKAAIRVEFQDLALLGEDLGGGLARAGGQLAEATPDKIRLDAAEVCVRVGWMMDFFFFCRELILGWG